MSAGNMGISQLECLQLRNLVGPSGVGLVTTNMVGNQNGGNIVATIPLTLQDGVAVGAYTSTLTVPSGTGLMRVTIETSVTGGQPLYYKVLHGSPGVTTSVGIPVDVGKGDGANGFAGWYYEGLMFYTNETSSPIPITLVFGNQYTATSASLLYFHVRTISFGPYVQQE